MCGFKVIALTVNGASCNCKFFNIHKTDDTAEEKTETPDRTLDEFSVIYKTINVHSPDQCPLFLINSWSNSFAHTRSRTLQVVTCMCG